MNRLPLALALVFSFAAAPAAAAVACRVTYGGETRTIAASPVASPYGVGTTAIGSYFLFRVVLRQTPPDLAAVKIYTYADREDGPALIHQASHPYPPPAAPGAAHGFTGLNFVYEPVRDGELQYWCALEPAPEARQ